jgi:hypothetical protein
MPHRCGQCCAQLKCGVQMFGDFFLLEREGQEPVRGERLRFGETADRNEAWLRDTLFAHPELLPLRDLDPSYGPLTPLCTELRTSAGPIDAAFINPFGRLTLVECKLWKNPQSRREVVAQILDYARVVGSWSYSDLQRQVAIATGRKGNAPFDLVSARNPGLVEQEFVDATADCLRQGRFLLVIAGDGIRQDVGSMAELISRNAASAFSFGLVEVALYGFPDGSLAVQPRAIAATSLIERTFVAVRDEKGLHAVEVGQPIPDGGEASSAAASTRTRPDYEGYREWWKPILDMSFDDPDQAPPVYYVNQVRVPLPIENTWLLANSMTSRAAVGVYLVDGSDGQRLYSVVRSNWSDLEPLLPEGSTLKPPRPGYSDVSCERAWSTFASEDEKRAWLVETINTFVNVFRPLSKEVAAALD